MATETTKKPRSKRRNFEKELTDLRRYCEISIDLMTGVKESLTVGPAQDHMAGQIAAIKAVLAKMKAA